MDVESHIGWNRSLVVVGNDKGTRRVGQIAGKEVNVVLNVNISQLYCSLQSRFIVRFDRAAFGCWGLTGQLSAAGDRVLSLCRGLCSGLCLPYQE